jgi:maleylpyruvate isomerase
MIKLYSYFRSSSSYRVRIALNLKGLEYETIPVHLLNDGGEQFKPEFSKLNPSHRLPVIIDEGQAIAQSVAIMSYLDARFADHPLIPEEPLAKAQCLQLTEIINSDIQPLQNLSVLKKLVKEHGFSEDEKVAWIQHWITLGLKSYETLLQKTAGKFSMGDIPSMPDCFLMPQLFNAHRFGVDMKAFTLINEIEKNCEEHPAFIKAHPSRQPDTPENS